MRARLLICLMPLADADAAPALRHTFYDICLLPSPLMISLRPPDVAAIAAAVYA